MTPARGVSARAVRRRASLLALGAVLEGRHAQFQQLFANVVEGFIVSVYEAADRAALEREFERLGFPFQEIHEVQMALTPDDLRRLVASHGG